MKRYLLSGALLALAGLSLAQGTFTIRRPADGATVRETVAIRLPKNSIPDGGYIGVYVNDKFLEAARPDVDASGEYVYRLDTKARKLPDGEHTIKVVLFVDFQDTPRIVNSSSIKVTVDNQTSIRLKPGGQTLRYTFTPGKEWNYSLKRRSRVSVISQALAQVGGRAAERDLSSESTRIRYAIDNAYGSGEGLVRIQGLPDKGKDYTIVTVSGVNQPTPRFAYEMHPIYMRVTGTGREIFSSAPPYIPLEGTGGDAARTDLFYVFPLPVLPTRAVSPGDVWNAPFLLGALDLDQKDEKDKYTVSIDSRGSFEGVEWYRGRRTAKIRMMASAGPEQLAGMQNINNVEGEAAKIEIEQVIWFDLDRGMVVRMDRTLTQESLIDAAPATGGFGGGPGGGFGGRGGDDDLGGGPAAPGGPGGMGGGRAAGGPRGSRGNAPDTFGDFNLTYFPTYSKSGGLNLFQFGPGSAPVGPGGPGFPGGQGRPGFGGGPPGAFGPGGGFGGFRPGMGAGTQTPKQVLRISQILSVEIE
jgi:hypothetical protein